MIARVNPALFHVFCATRKQREDIAQQLKAMADKKDEKGKSSGSSGSRSIIDEIGRERAEALMAAEVQKAVARADALGLPQVVRINGAWCRRYPDGRVEAIPDTTTTS